MKGPEDEKVISELLNHVSAQMFDLARLLSQLSHQLQASADLSDAVRLAKKRSAWRLLSHGSALVTPAGAKIVLSPAEGQFLIMVFTAPNGELVIPGASLNKTHAPPEKPYHSLKSLSVVVSRLKARCAQWGVDLPLRSMRGQGYAFVEPVDVSELDTAAPGTEEAISSNIDH